MKKIYIIVITLFSHVVCFANGQKQPIYYIVSFPNVKHHEAEIEITVPQTKDGVLRVRMSRASPGRYATQEFGKNIYNVKALNDDGSIAPVQQVEGDVYEIPRHQKTVKIYYTLFGNYTDGTYVGIDPSHAHLNMPATFMWVEGEDERPIFIKYKNIDTYGWKIATQMNPEPSNWYSAPNLQYMMDSPTELSAFKETSWQVKNTDGKVQGIYLKVHSDDNQKTIDNFAGMLQKIVLEAKAVFGELPAYDFGNYTFITDVYPTNTRDGMEHRNSTSIVRRMSKIDGNESGMLISFAHEFFHSWNVERIRPKTLEPFNFKHSNMSNELWFAEGFTEYYGTLLLVRSGFKSVADYTSTISLIVNSVLNTPAALRYNQAQMSRYAVFSDNGVFIDPTNKDNIFADYYYYGGATALALDFRLRKEFNLSLDDFMREVWIIYGKTEKPYTIADLQNTLAKVTGNAAFAADFFSRYIYGVEKNDYSSLLANAGLSLIKSKPGEAWVGPFLPVPACFPATVSSNPKQKGFPLIASTITGTPLYKSGLDAGDIILKADGNSIENLSDFVKLIAGKKPGERILVDYTNRTGNHTTNIILEENPELKVVTWEMNGKQITPAQQKFRNSWLTSKVN